MPDALSVSPKRRGPVDSKFLSRMLTSVRAQDLSRLDVSLAALSAALLILSFPNFNLWPLAWFGLAPLVIALLRSPRFTFRAFILGWIAGTVFFYGSCYWLTYAAIRYGNVPTIVAYLALIPASAIGGLFPAFFALLLGRVIARFGIKSLLFAPFIWVAMEWARLGITGQLWNAIGYSQAFVPSLIQSARWGGVYAIGFLILTTNAAIAFVWIRRSRHSVGVTGVTIVCIAVIIVWQNYASSQPPTKSDPSSSNTVVIAIQPNVPMEPVESLEETDALVARHVAMSKNALDAITNPTTQRVVIWPESPMNFMYARDPQFRDLLAAFTKANRTSVVLNALEPAPDGGSYNAAIMVNEEGRLTAQYDKIRLLPFGEYVPIPRWVPGASFIPAMVGDFTPGVDYPLLQLGNARAGIFICYEAAFPYIARRFANDGADLLVNISNDGYLGPTPVMKQHLANAVFRAVENRRPLLRVTNTGITAYITPQGTIQDATNGYETAVRTWSSGRTSNVKTFYTRHGDLFVGFCAAVTLLLLVASSSSIGKLLNLKI